MNGLAGDVESEPMHSHEGLKRIRKRRKHTRRLSENRELLASVIVMVGCGLLLVALVTYLLSTRACHAPKYFQWICGRRW